MSLNAISSTVIFGPPVHRVGADSSAALHYAESMLLFTPFLTPTQTEKTEALHEARRCGCGSVPVTSYGSEVDGGLS